MPVAKLTDLEKVRRIRAHKRTRKNLLLLALAAILVFFSVSLEIGRASCRERVLLLV